MNQIRGTSVAAVRPALPRGWEGAASQRSAGGQPHRRRGHRGERRLRPQRLGFPLSMVTSLFGGTYDQQRGGSNDNFEPDPPGQPAIQRPVGRLLRQLRECTCADTLHQQADEAGGCLQLLFTKCVACRAHQGIVEFCTEFAESLQLPPASCLEKCCPATRFNGRRLNPSPGRVSRRWRSHDDGHSRAARMAAGRRTRWYAPGEVSRPWRDSHDGDSGRDAAARLPDPRCPCSAEACTRGPP
jgi:hypothetical protein